MPAAVVAGWHEELQVRPAAERETALDEPDPTIPPEYAERLRTQGWREPLPG